MMASTHRVLITGASGLLGRSIFKTFSGSDQWEVLGLAHSRASGALRKVNLLDFDEAKRVVEEFRPDVLIHSAAERRPDVAENDQETSTKMNVGVSEILASAVNELNKDLPKAEHYMLYISSCYVFDGKSPPYKPTDKPNPLNKYGKTKLQGEQVVISCLPAAGVLRVPILYGCVEYLQESSVTVLFDVLKQTNKPVKVDDYQVRFPTMVDDIAVVCRFIAEKHLSTSSMDGIWHWSGTEAMSKYSMVCQMAELFGLSHTHITPNRDLQIRAPRPDNPALECSLLESMMHDGGACARTPFKEGIQKCLHPFL